MSNLAGSVPTMERASAVRPIDRDAEGRAWIAALRADGTEREVAAASLHAMLLRAAHWSTLPARVLDPVEDLEMRERLQAIVSAIRTELSPHQREVLSALVLAGVPIDVLAERLGTTRGALYKTLHDARRKLRTAIGAEHDGLT